MTQTPTPRPTIEPDEESETVQLLVADAGNRSAISGMLDEQFDVETSQSITDADLYLIEDHLFPEYRAALHEQVKREDPVFCPVVLIRRERTDLGQGDGNTSASDGPVRYDEVVDAPVNQHQLRRRLHSLLVRRQQSQELMQQLSTLEEREQRLRLFEQGVKSTGSGIVMTDSAGTIEYVNPALESIVGYTEDDILGKSPQTLLPDGASAVFDEEFWQTLADQTEWEGDIIIEAEDSQRRVVNATATALHDAENETEGFVIVLSDITERIQREQDLEDREEELDLLQQILIRYFRHNMRNNLNVIQANAELLTRDESLSQEQINSVEAIIENSEDLIEKSETARTYSSLLGKDAELSTFDLSETTEAAVQAIRQEYPDVKFEVDVPETCEIRARDGIQRAIEELIDNAAQHNDTTEPCVRIQIRDYRGTRLVIEDNGPGISQQERESLESGTETQLTHSQGVGLWLSKWLIEGINGQLSIEVTDTGTRVTADFPSVATTGSTVEEITTLKEREQRLQTIKDRMTDSIIEVDAELTITRLDERAKRIFDKEGATVVGQKLWAVCPALRDTQFETIIRDAMESRSATSVEGYLPELDAGLEVNVYPEFDGGLTFYTRDITERKEQEAVLKRNTRAIDEAPIGITIADVTQDDTPLIYVNEGFEKITGYDREDGVGQNCRFLQGTDTAEKPVTEMREAIESGEPVTVELLNYRKNGTEFWNRVSIAPIHTEDGSISHYVGFQQEITEQKRHAEQLRALHERARMLMTADTGEEAAEIGVGAASEILGLDASSIHLYDAEQSGLVPVASTDILSDMLGDLPVFTSGDSIAWRVYERGEAVALDDVQDDPDRYNPETSMRSELYLPLADHGILLAGSPTPDAFDEHDVVLGQILAANLTSALDQITKTERL